MYCYKISSAGCNIDYDIHLDDVIISSFARLFLKVDMLCILTEVNYARPIRPWNSSARQGPGSKVYSRDTVFTTRGFQVNRQIHLKI